MIFILLFIVLLFVPIIIKVHVEKIDEFKYNVLCKVAWNLIYFRYRSGKTADLRISFFNFKLFEEDKKKEKQSKRWDIKKSQRKDVKKKGKFDYHIILNNYRRILRVLKKVINSLYFSGFFNCRYSLGNPATDGASYGYFIPVIEMLRSKKLKLNVFPSFGKFDLFFETEGEVEIKTYLFNLFFLSPRIFSDVIKLKKEFESE
ncbi:hypothetical protein KAU33_14685 [Candidatus Dependentiae bacterium]|nr:hypothetical protein [Candidatus Dependentiae bacterium]